MKTILVPIDFSEASDNALNYAVAFAENAGLQISLLNVYDYPTVSSDPVVWVPSANQLIAEHLKKLEKMRKKIHKHHGDQLDIQCYCEPGRVIETIQAFIAKHPADLIVMGLQGGGFISEMIIGSTTASLMRTSPCPVLGVPKRVKFQPIRRIVLATDYKGARYAKVLKPLKELIGMFDSYLFVFYVIEPTIITPKKAVTNTSIRRALGEIPYTPHTMVHTDFTVAIDQFIEDNKIDLAVIVPRKHSIVYSLFHEASTKKLAFHTEVPLLALHA